MSDARRREDKRSIEAGLAEWLRLTETEKGELAESLELLLQAGGGNPTRASAAQAAPAQRSLSVWVLRALCARPPRNGLLAPPCPRTLAAWHHLAERRSARQAGTQQTQRRRVHGRIWHHLDAMTPSSSTQPATVAAEAAAPSAA